MTSRYLSIVMTTGEEMIVYSVNGSHEDALSHLMVADGGWVHAEVRGYGPDDVWLNTAQIVSIKEVE